MDGGVVAFGVAILIVGLLIFIAILLTGKRSYTFNKEVYQARFLAIENKLKKDNPASYAMCIIESDKLLDRALHEMGTQGKTTGDRLKKASSKFTEVNSVWRAHKFRNAVAHDTDFEVSYQQAKNILAVYKQALKDLGAI